MPYDPMASVLSLGTSLQEEEEEEEEEEEQIGVTVEDIKKISAELGIVSLCWPEIKDPYFEGRTHFPKSYYTNNDKERLVLLYAENFRRQFKHNYAKRNPILLACDNECGIQKMVCTTIRPTMHPYRELYEWSGCASFVADHVRYEPFESPTVLPNRLMSPASLMYVEHGNSFEIATLLVSMLIGQGYDAYICSGYATQDVASNIMVRTSCPDQLETIEKVKEMIVEEVKYKLRSPVDLNSQYAERLMKQEEEIEKREWERSKNKRLAAIRELEKPPFDPLHGWRVHAWVIVLPGKRNIETPFFIEPSTGFKHPLNFDGYLGLETVWNCENYWINLQDCSNGVGEIQFDLSDLEKWEHLLVGEPILSRVKCKELPAETGTVFIRPVFFEKHLDMPTSWSEIISLPYPVFERRYNGGKKLIEYKKCRVELFSPYLQDDGLVKRAVLYDDYEYTDPARMFEFFENRDDCMIKMETDLDNDFIVATFTRGREDAVREHRYFIHEPTTEDRRIIKYNASCRHDGLKFLEMSPMTLQLDFENREDFLTHRYVSFFERGDGPEGMKEGRYRFVMHVLEKFDRNVSKEAHKDVRIREFAVGEGQIRLKYHYVKGKITFTTRSFMKPPISETGENLKLDPEKTGGYISEDNVKPPRQLQLLVLLQELLEEEEKSLLHIRLVDEMLEAFLNQRNVELAMPKLRVSEFHPTRNTEYRDGMLKMEEAQRQKSEREVDVKVDYLGPYLARLGKSRDDHLAAEEAKIVYNDCMDNFKHTLMTRVFDMQRQFLEVSADLEEKRKWYQSIQDTLTRAEAEDYFASLSGQIFLMHCLELRLDRHKELAPARYIALNNALQNDNRLAALFVRISLRKSQARPR